MQMVLDQQAEAAMREALPWVVRSVKFDFRSAAEQLSAEFGTPVDADWCRLAFAEAHKAATGKQHAAATPQPLRSDHPLPPPPSSSSAVAPVPTGSSHRAVGSSSDLEQKKEVAAADSVQAKDGVHEGEEDDADSWSWQDWLKQHKAEAERLTEQRKALFEKVLASMSTDTMMDDSRYVEIPHDIQEAMLERHAREEAEKRMEQSRAEREWIEEQRAALKNRFAADSVDAEGIDPLHNREFSSADGEWKDVAEQPNRPPQEEDIVLQDALEGMDFDLDALLDEVEASLPARDDALLGAATSELGEVLQYLERAAQQQQKASVPKQAQKARKTHVNSSSDDHGGRQQSNRKLHQPADEKSERKDSVQKTAPTIRITAPQNKKLQQEEQREEQEQPQSPKAVPPTNSQEAGTTPASNRQQAGRGAQVSRKMGGIWASSSSATDKTWEGDSSEDEDGDWQQQRRQIKASRQTYVTKHAQIAGSLPKRAAVREDEDGQANMSFQTEVEKEEEKKEQPEPHEMPTDMKTTTATETETATAAIAIAAVRKEAEEVTGSSNLKKQEAEVTSEKQQATLTAEVTGSLFTAPTVGDTQPTESQPRSNQGDRMKSSIQQAKERRMRALAQQEQQEQQEQQAAKSSTDR